MHRLLKPFVKLLGLSALMLAGTAQSGPFTLGIAQQPLFVKQVVPPRIMLNMARDHKLYYEAYDDKSDISGDGKIDVGYKGYQPGFPDYYGYFNSQLCYTYNTGSRIFEPVAKVGANKTCTGQWSGDFLNYLTTARIDALRKVLFGGDRSDDTAAVNATTPGKTVLERAYIPQDAHSWGKEYTSPTVNGYSLSDYTSLSNPVAGTRTLFASTSLLCGSSATVIDASHPTTDPGCPTSKGQPLLRVLQNTSFRVWEWVSIERPVAGHRCLHGDTGPDCAGPAAFVKTLSIADHNAFLTAVSTYGTAANLVQSGTFDAGNGNAALNRIGTSDGAGLFASIAGHRDYQLTVATATLNVASGKSGSYEFNVDGDDAIEFSITPISGSVNGSAASTETVVATWYGGHGADGKCTQSNSGITPARTGGSTSGLTVTLGEGSYTLTVRHHEQTGNEGMALCWKGPGSSNAWDYIKRRTDGTSGMSTAFSYSQWDVKSSASTLTDYRVKVKVCDPFVGSSDTALIAASIGNGDCKAYTSSGGVLTYKPIGVLQEYGDTGKVVWGLASGTFRNNQRGGVIRKDIAPLINGTSVAYPSGVSAEINPDGTFSSYYGMIKFMSDLTVDGFGSDYQYSGVSASKDNCGWFHEGSGKGIIPGNGQCRSWGNPVGEMMYEAIKYFAGLSPSSEFNNNLDDSNGDYVWNVNDASARKLGRVANWNNSPYKSGNAPWCAKPFVLTMSDVNTSYDDDDLPGTSFGAGVADPFSPSAPMNVTTLADMIWSNEPGLGGSKNVFIGYSQDATSSENLKSSPSPKPATSFARIRGHAPEEPSKKGSYYSAAVALYGHTKRLYDMNNALGSTFNKSNAPTIGFFNVVLNSPLPSIDIPLTFTSGTITFQPFGKSTSLDSGSTPPAPQWGSSFYPTDQIVDFYVDTVANVPGADTNPAINGGRPYYRFRINYEDVEQGADHDMDAIATYTIKEVDPATNGGNNIQIDVSSDYGAGGITQHLGYFISGTTADRAYLVVRDPCGACANNGTHPDDAKPNLGLTDTRQFKVQSGVANAIRLKDPLWYASKYGAFTDVSGNKLPDATSVTRDYNGTAVIGTEWQKNPTDVDPLGYYKVSSPALLKSQLQQALDDILSTNGAGAAVAATTSNLNAQSKVYQALFDVKNSIWVGNIKQLSINPLNGSTYVDTGDWEADTALYSSAAARNIYTYKFNSSGDQGQEFKYDNLSSTEKDWIKNWAGPPARTLANDALGAQVIDYIRGVGRSYKMGSIVNSTPVLVQAPDDVVTSGGVVDTSYTTFKDTYKNRAKTLWFASNEGMIHGLDTSDGHEIFAYVPYPALQSINTQLDLDQFALGTAPAPKTATTHVYLADGSPTAKDAVVNGNWETVLAGGLNRGGKSIYLLKITDPSSMNQSNVLWEFNTMNPLAEAGDLGYTYARPRIYKMNNGQWAVVFGNGYNSTSEKAVLYVAFIDGGLDGIWTLGTDYIKIVADNTVGGGNGLSSPTGADVNLDGKVDYVYAGDLKGNMWKFDLTSATPASWSVAMSGSPLFVAKDSVNKVQPITSPPSIGYHPLSKGADVTGKSQMLFFGTGKYLENCDADAATGCTTHSNSHSFYGVWDHNDPNLTRSNLVPQTLVTSYGSPNTRAITSNSPVAWYAGASVNKWGWYHDLDSSKKEKVVAPSFVYSCRVYYTTLTPDGDVCSPAGYSFIMQPCAANGGNSCCGVADPGASNSTTAAVGGFTPVIFMPLDHDDGATADYTASFKSITEYSSGTNTKAGGALINAIDGTISVQNLNFGDPVSRMSWKELLK